MNRTQSASPEKIVARSAAWMFAMRIVIRVLGIISTIVLARLLIPEDFGLVALAITVVAVIEILGEFSFDLTLIQDQTATRDKYDTVWTMGLLRGFLAALLIALSAAPASDFFQEARLENVILILAISPAIAGLVNVGIVDFRKNLNFKYDFAILVIPKIFSFTVTILLAFALRNYWALVAGTISSTVCSTIASYAMHPYRPRLCMKEYRNVLLIGRWLLANNLLTFVATRLDTFIVARTTNAHVLGIFSVASEIASLPASEFVQPLARALFPNYARLLQDEETFNRIFRQSVAVVWSALLPSCIGLAMVAEPLIRVAFGDGWAPAIPLLEILAVASFLRVGLANSSAAYLAQGRVAFVAFFTGYSTAVRAAGLFIGASVEGVIGLAWGMLFAETIILISSSIAASKYLGIKFRDLAIAIWRSIASTCIMAMSLALLERLLPTGLGHTLVLGIAVFFGVLSYGVASVIFWLISGRPNDGAEAVFFRLVRKALNGHTRVA